MVFQQPLDRNLGSRQAPGVSEADKPMIPKSCEAIDWPVWEPTMLATLLFLRCDGRVLLMRKKRGLGAGKINAPGGKIDPGETAIACAIRETEEELCVRALDPEHRGRLHFQFVDGLAIRCDVFLATRYTGEVGETDEGEPFWFAESEIPYEEMWADDPVWLPGVLAGKSFLGYFIFDDEQMLDRHLEWDVPLPDVTRVESVQ